MVDAGAADPREVAEAVKLRYEQTDYDFAAEWPVRMAVILHDGAPTHLVAIMTHFVMDGCGALVMLEESARRDRAGRRDAGPRTGAVATLAGRAAAERGGAAILGDVAARDPAAPVRR